MSPRAEQLRGFRCPLSSCRCMAQQRNILQAPREHLCFERSPTDAGQGEGAEVWEINSWRPDKDSRLTTPTLDAVYFHRGSQHIPSGELN